MRDGTRRWPWWPRRHPAPELLMGMRSPSRVFPVSGGVSSSRPRPRSSSLLAAGRTRHGSRRSSRTWPDPEPRQHGRHRSGPRSVTSSSIGRVPVRRASSAGLSSPTGRNGRHSCPRGGLRGLMRVRFSPGLAVARPEPVRRPVALAWPERREGVAGRAPHQVGLIAGAAGRHQGLLASGSAPGKARRPAPGRPAWPPGWAGGRPGTPSGRPGAARLRPRAASGPAAGLGRCPSRAGRTARTGRLPARLRRRHP